MSLRVFCVSLPKCGTHLLRSCLLRLGLDHSAFEVSAERELAVQATYRTYQVDDPERWFWGNAPSVVAPSLIESGFQALLAELANLQPGTFLHGHYAYEPRLAAALRTHGIAVVVISRDPRAALLSMADYLLQRREPRELAQRLPTETAALYEALVAGNDVVRSLQENFDAYRDWLDDPEALVVHFEDLVGPQGGGSIGRQAATITRIAQHAGLEASPALVARAMQQTFDRASPTFSHGHSERWRETLPASVLSLVEWQASAALATWSAPAVPAEDDRHETATMLAAWTAALAEGSASADMEISALRAEIARKQAIIDEWVGRAFALQEAAWKHAATEQGLMSALDDGNARLALIYQQQENIAALIRERDRSYADSDERLALIHQQQAALAELRAQRTRFAEESDERLALIHRQQARISDLIVERDRFAVEDALSRG